MNIIIVILMALVLILWHWEVPSKQATVGAWCAIAVWALLFLAAIIKWASSH
jgi:hypothetical protein